MARKTKTERDLDQLVANATASMALLNDGMKKAGVKRFQRRQIQRAILGGALYVSNGTASGETR